MDGTAKFYTDMGIEHLSGIPGYDPSYEVLYYNSWSDYEEHGWQAILFRNGYYFSIGGGYSVMSGNNEDCWNLWSLTEDEAMDEVELYEHMLAKHE